MAVSQRLAFLPGAIFIGEVYALAERRMVRLQQSDQDIRTRDGQIFLLQFDEGRRRRVIVARDLDAEAVGLAFIVARVGKGDWLGDLETDVEEQDDQRQ